MTDRILLSQDRLLITKPGIDASGNPAEDDKVFDSDWHFGGAIIETGYKEVLRVFGNGNYVIDFQTPLSYVPLVQCYSALPPWRIEFDGSSLGNLIQGPPVFYEYYPSGDPNGRVRDFITVTNSQIIIPNRRFTSDFGQIQGPVTYFKEGGSNKPAYHCFFYLVFAL